MRTAVLLPEMIQAGVEAYSECRARQYESYDIVIAIYLSMEAIREISDMRKQYETVH